MKKFIVSASLLAVSLATSGSVNAATAASTLNVSATVIPACTVSTIPVNFGNLVADEYTSANGDISVNCATGVPYVITLDAGLHSGSGYRYMKEAAGTAIAFYVLYSDIFGSDWGDYGYASTIQGLGATGTGNGLFQSHIVYGSARGNDAFDTVSPPGQYSDTVNVTVYY